MRLGNWTRRSQVLWRWCADPSQFRDQSLVTDGEIPKKYIANFSHLNTAYDWVFFTYDWAKPAKWFVLGPNSNPARDIRSCREGTRICSTFTYYQLPCMIVIQFNCLYRRMLSSVPSRTTAFNLTRHTRHSFSYSTRMVRVSTDLVWWSTPPR